MKKCIEDSTKITKQINNFDSHINQKSSNISTSDKTAHSYKEITEKEFVRLLEDKKLIIYTGAGISSSSGITPFVGPNSLEEKFHIDEGFPDIFKWLIEKPSSLFLTIGTFQSKFLIAEPSLAHIAVTKLEKKGLVDFIITSNFDSLHELAGSENVYFSKLYASFMCQIKTYDENNILLIVGISRDEDSIIQNFKSSGNQIVVVDVLPPKFLSGGDWHIKGKSDSVLSNLASEFNTLSKRGTWLPSTAMVSCTKYIQWKKLLEKVCFTSNSQLSEVHGENHWMSVACIGHELIKYVGGADPTVVLLFSLLHDCVRSHDGSDPLHGQRASELAKSLNGDLFLLTNTQSELLESAIFAHSDGYISRDPTIGVCWDSDRLDLWRVDMEPDPNLLSTNVAKTPSMIRWSKKDNAKKLKWDKIFSKYQYIMQKSFE